jgi:hypothetical protein
MSSGGWTGLAVAGVTAAYALGSRRLSSTPLTPAIVFVGSGILLGPAVLNIVDLRRDAAPILALLEVTLTLVLFTDAMTVRRGDLVTGGFLPGRLLGIGLPLSLGSAHSSAPSSCPPTSPSKRPPSPVPAFRHSSGTASMPKAA